MVGLEGITRFMSGAGSAKDVYGRRPVVPEFPSYSEALREITQGNIDALPSLQSLGIKSTKAYSEMMEAAYPGITDLKTEGTAAIKGLLSGNVPGLDEYVQRRGSELSRASGTSGSQFGFGQEINFGFNERLKTTQIGLDAATRWIEQSRNQTFDFSKMFLGPQDAIRQAEGRWSRDWLSEQVQAAPDPTARGMFDAEMSWIGMVLSAYGGGPGYTGQNRQMYGSSLQGATPTTAGGGGSSYFGDVNWAAVSAGNSIYNSVPVDNYGYGQTPEGTHWNTKTNSSTYGAF